MDSKEHWEHVYTTRQPHEVGWYEPHLRTSLDWIRDLALPTDARILDVGGGACTLVDDLLADGSTHVSVLDLSGAALATVQMRLGRDAERVAWLEGDVTSIELPADAYDLWHDRAVLHFLAEPSGRRKYAEQLRRALKPGGRAIIGVFSPEAPPRCSGLPVERYTVATMAALLGNEFTLERQAQELHVTPGGTEQMYVYCQFLRASRPPPPFSS
jgi:SAM-dependent methyltransferase